MTLPQEITKEATRLEEDTLYSAKRHFNEAMTWRWVHYILGIVATVAATASAAVPKPSVSDGSWSCVLAVLAAIAAGLMTFLNPQDRVKAHMRIGNEYDAVRNDVRRFRNIEMKAQVAQETLIGKLNGLAARKANLNKESPATSRRAYRNAKKGIEEGEATHAVDVARNSETGRPS